MHQFFGSYMIDLFALVGVVFVVVLFAMTPVKKPFLKWKWIAIGLAVAAILLKIADAFLVENQGIMGQ